MKFFAILFTIFLSVSYARAQEINYKSIMGTWQYKSPNGKNKLSYKFDVEKKFVSTLERNENETITEGMFEFDKKGEFDRLILTFPDKENSVRTLMTYHFIKFIGADTIKLQHVNVKQAEWYKENRRNTMVFVRKKDKPKEEAK
jgi:hypothetical protein